jgi:DNA (cytosine-5)-methyltransferase 1
MKYLSVCSGIEAATVAWHPLGWSPVAFAEIEKFPSAVLAHHYPSVPNLGDMTKFKDWPDADIDVLVGGTPCQSFSVAGLRQGLADPRGNLCLTYLAIADRYRPEWLLWENVPGVLSSDGGRDFGAFLGGLGQLGYGWSYRVLDAQYVRVDGFGRAVPQRRRRVFVVGNLRDWRRSAAVLFERESLQGNTPPRRQAGQGLTAEIAPSIVSSGRGVERAGDTRGQDPVVAVAGALMAKEGRGVHSDMDTFVAHSLRAEGFDASEDGTGRGTPIIPLNLQVITRHEALGRGTGFGMGEVGDPAYTLSKTHQHAIAFAQNQREEVREQLNVAGALAAEPGMKQQTYLAVADTLTSNGDAHSGFRDEKGLVPIADTAWAVRRLTPIECERLQGFPDDYTQIPWRGKNGAPDGPRYKALGNSMAVNAMRWLGRRIELVSTLSSQQGNTP